MNNTKGSKNIFDLTPKRTIIQAIIPLFLGIVLVSLVMVVGSAGAEAEAVNIEMNGLYWADNDYQDYWYISESEPNGRGFLYGRNVGNDTVYALVRVSYTVNDNAFSNDKAYTGSVWWSAKHNFISLLNSDHLAIFMECDVAGVPSRFEWSQDLVYDADVGPGNDWRSDQFGPDGLAVSSSTGAAIPGSGIVLASASSTEYNLENSSHALNPPTTDIDLWQSPDLAPFGTISTTNPLTDVNAITGAHEDYPFYMSTGTSPADLWEWEISYEMKLDVGHCDPGTVFLGADSSHNSPAKDGHPDIDIPTAVTMSSAAAAADAGPLFVVVAGFGFLMITTGAAWRVSKRRNRED